MNMYSSGLLSVIDAVVEIVLKVELILIGVAVISRDLPVYIDINVYISC